MRLRNYLHYPDSFLCINIWVQILLYNQSVDIQNQIQDLRVDNQNSENSLKVSFVGFIVCFVSTCNILIAK